MRIAIIELCFPNPERPNPELNAELVNYIKEKVKANDITVIDWCDSIYTELIKIPSVPETVPKG